MHPTRKGSWLAALVGIGLQACLGATGAADQAGSLPSAEAFFMPTGILQTALSPDGSRLVYTRVEGQKTDILLLDLNTGATVSLMRPQRVTALYWKGNDTIVFNDPSFISAGIITLSTHAFRQLADLSEQVRSFSMVSAGLESSPTDVVVGSRLVGDSAARINVLTGAYELLFAPLKPMNGESTSTYVADRSGAVRARIYYAPTGAQLQYRRRGEWSFRTVKGWPAGEPRWELQGVADDGSNLLVITRDESDFGALHVFDPERKQLGPSWHRCRLPRANSLPPFFRAMDSDWLV